MGIYLGNMYHWTPKPNRESILKNGLTVLNECIDAQYRTSWICLADTPSSAWGLLPVDPVQMEFDVWDLWQVDLIEGDQLQIRGDFSPYVREVRVMHGLPADRVWWVGEREIHPHISMAYKKQELMQNLNTNKKTE